MWERKGHLFNLKIIHTNQTMLPEVRVGGSSHKGSDWKEKQGCICSVEWFGEFFALFSDFSSELILVGYLAMKIHQPVHLWYVMHSTCLLNFRNSFKCGR
jgi:hypothetical protein